MNDVIARFWAKVDAGGPDDCWLWTASRYQNGYGQFNHGLAHRFSVELSGREIPVGFVVDHLCRNRPCVNPRHLDVVPQAVNVARGVLPSIAGKRMQEWSETRTHCINGHELTPENEYRPPGKPTWRVCRTCKRNRKAKR